VTEAEAGLGLSTVSIYMGIQATIIWAPYLSRLALKGKEQFDGTVDGLVTPRIRLSSDGHVQAV